MGIVSTIFETKSAEMTFTTRPGTYQSGTTRSIHKGLGTPRTRQGEYTLHHIASQSGQLITMNSMSDDGDRKSLGDMKYLSQPCSPVLVDERLRRQRLRPILELPLRPVMMWDVVNMTNISNLSELSGHTCKTKGGGHITFDIYIFITSLRCKKTFISRCDCSSV